MTSTEAIIAKVTFSYFGCLNKTSHSEDHSSSNSTSVVTLGTWPLGILRLNDALAQYLLSSRELSYDYRIELKEKKKKDLF